MDGFVTSQNLLERYKTFREQNDLRYIRLKNSDSSSLKGGIITLGDGLEIDGDTLNVTSTSGGSPSGGGSGYTLKPATNDRLGGIIVGNGLEVESDGTLNVTLTGGSGSTYQNFTGATSTSNGTRGLVPAPSIGDQNKFLCGNGRWVSIKESSTTLEPSVSGSQGAFWQDFIDGEPCFKLRYGEYEYNFLYDERIKYKSGEYIPPDTTNPGSGYILSQSIPENDGVLWYEVKEELPQLKMRLGSFEYAFNYTSITYKGDDSSLVSYLPCNRLPVIDTCVDPAFLTSTEKELRIADENDVALYTTGIEVSAENPAPHLYGNAITANPDKQASLKLTYSAGAIPSLTADTGYLFDYWFFFSGKAITDKKNIDITPNVAVTSANKLKLLVNSSSSYVIPDHNADYYADKPHHLAVYVKKELDKSNKSVVVSRIALDGKYIVRKEQQTATLFMHKKNTMYFTEYSAFNKIRVFSKIIYPTDFEPPKPEEYR